MKNNRITRSRRNDKKNNYGGSGGGGWKKWLKYILLGLAILILAGVVAGAGLFTYYASSAPDLTQEDLYGTYASDLVDKDGEVFYTLGGENRDLAEAEEYPQVLIDSVVAIEDQRFFDHLGVDPIGITRAAWDNLRSEGIASGGSTITQQLVKLSVFSTKREDQTLERKAQEAWLAVQLEQELTKEEIMTLYLNKVHMGGNVYGMATAAEEYYGKHVSELELHEAALLAGMPQAPNYYDPYENPEVSKNRRDTVIYAMVDYGAITEEEAQEAYRIPVQEGLVELDTTDENTLVYDSYITAVLEEVREKTNYDPYTAGLTIHTNLDRDAQQLAYDVAHSDEYVDFPNEELQTAISIIDADTGEISAVIGGRNIEGHLSNNRATGLNRSVGSTIKPLTVYGPAVEFEQYSTYHQVVDEPYTASGTDWSPSNWDNSYNGQMSLREALVESRNIPAAKIFNEDLNHDEVSEFLEGLGIDSAAVPGNSEVDELVASSAIDGHMTPMQLAGAYSAFANEGVYTEPHSVNTIITQENEEIDMTPESHQAMEDYTAYMITDMLKGVIDYYGSSLSIPGLNHAGKTGTTNYNAEQRQEYNIPSGGVPDSWFVGYTPNYSMSVWVGYDQFLQEGNYLSFDDGTRQLPRYIYREIMSRLSEGMENDDWEMPDTVVEENIIDGSNPPVRASSSTPSGQVVTELFVHSNLPDATGRLPESEENEEDEEETEEETVELSAPAGLTANYDENSDILRASWDSYELENGGSVSYAVTIGGNTSVINSNSISLTGPPVGEVTVSVAVQVDGQTGPAAQTTVTVPGEAEEPEQPEDEQPEETEEPEEEAPEEEPEQEPEQEPETEQEPEQPEEPETPEEQPEEPAQPEEPETPAEPEEQPQEEPEQPEEPETPAAPEQGSGNGPDGGNEQQNGSNESNGSNSDSNSNEQSNGNGNNQDEQNGDTQDSQPNGNNGENAQSEETNEEE